MPYVTQEGRALPMDKAFSHNNKSFGATWLRLSTPEQKDAEGISWETPVDPPVVRAPLEREKSDGVARAKDTANKMLAGSDWQVIAKTERGREIPEDVSQYRSDVIAECARLEEQFSTAESYEAIDAIQQNWPLTQEEQAMLTPEPTTDKDGNEEEGKEEGQ